MKVYSYSQARQKLTEVLNRSRSESVIIRRRGGEAFHVSPQSPRGSPLDVRGVRTDATTSHIVSIIREIRRGPDRLTRPRKRPGTRTGNKDATGPK